MANIVAIPINTIVRLVPFNFGASSRFGLQVSTFHVYSPSVLSLAFHFQANFFSVIWLGNKRIIRSSAARVTALRLGERSIRAAMVGETQ
jgi:hypothetical protein